MTGRYTFRTTTKWGHLPPGEITFGHVLSRAGYATALAGKWQMALLADDPQHVTRNGFQHNACWAWHEGPRYWQPMIYKNGRVLDGVADKYGPDVYCDFLIDFVDKNKDRPFLAYYPMTVAHFAKTGGQHVEPKGPNGQYQTFAEMIEQMDRQVGKLVAALDRLGLREKTLILFTGDNGSPTKVTSKLGNRSIKGGKGTLTDAGTRVPLIANWPGTIPGCMINDDLIDFSDFLPTLAELAGASPPDGVIIDGHSFVPALLDKQGTPREWVYTEWKGNSWVRDKRWKLYDKGKLYDMKDDPREKDPITKPRDSKESAAARKRLTAVFDKLESSHKP